MVKGISKRIVLVKALPNSAFEEAIFILKEDSSTKGLSEEEMIREAIYVATSANVRGRRLPHRVTSAATYGALGGIIVGLIWVISTII